MNKKYTLGRDVTEGSRRSVSSPLVLLKNFLVLAIALPLFSAGTAHAVVVYNSLLGTSVGGTADTCPSSLVICASNFTVNNAVFGVAPENTGAGSGAGAFNPFLRLINDNNNNTFEKGYNTDARSWKPNGDYEGPATLADPRPGNKTEFDELDDPKTRRVLVGALETVIFDGDEYFQLLLDVNEPNPANDLNKKLISLQTLELYVGTSPLIDMYADLGTKGTKIWDLDAGTEGDSEITIDPIVSPGSGSYDLVALFPVSLLLPYPDDENKTHYLYLYNELGNIDNLTSQCIPSSSEPNGCAADAGFEEWAFFAKAYTPPGPGPGPLPADVPEPAPLALLALGGLLIGWMKRKQRA